MCKSARVIISIVRIHIVSDIDLRKQEFINRNNVNLYLFSDTPNRKYVRHEPGAIATRHRASLIETSDGKLYRLVNPFVKSRSNIEGFY